MNNKVKQRDAYCDSASCNRKEFPKEIKHVYILKKVKVTEMFCPDCGSALFWVTDGKVPRFASLT